MKKQLVLLSFLLLFIVQYSWAQQILKGRVVRVSDGDSFVLLDSLNQQHRIRLYGIDSPERGQGYYQVAKNFMGELCFQKNVDVRIINRDLYQRIVGIVYIDTLNINLSILKSGLAWHFTQFDHSEEYAQAEKEAKLNKRNIWSLKNEIAPWEFRKTKRQQQLLKKQKQS